MRDPIVIEPAGFNPKEGWHECHDYVEQCGGLTHSDGSPNWRAAAGADPGCMSCPKCREFYWKWGSIVECLDCGFRFPTDWWPAYSYGVQATRSDVHPKIKAYMDEKHLRRLAHPYYRYGFEHPVEEPWKEHDKIDWATVVGSMDTYPAGVRMH